MSPLPSPGEPALDVATGLDRLMGDRAMYLRVVARFRADYAGAVAHLRAALAAADLALAQRLAHTIKGAAAMIEARTLRALAQELEHGLRAGAPADHALAARMDTELARVIVQVDALLASAAVPEAGGSGTLDDGDMAQLCTLLDLGDSGAQEFVARKRAGLCARLGEARMAELEQAVAAFDFERALATLPAVHAAQPRS
ncbi:Hpt domain-containing protein [Massilia sp. MS-15]|uniref:Hpt domain-containing protein n=1 Tax=Massilia sp. MS-15 TaxID=2878200 RepID=UPI001CD2D3BF|nr:Hpt domain-containing protein [Massilia sp. MS-15]